MIAGHSNRDAVVAKLKRELAGAQELFMLPAGNVVVGGHAREPLRYLVNVVAVSGEEFIPRAPADLARIIDVVVPINGEDSGLIACEGLRQIKAHHRLD